MGGLQVQAHEPWWRGLPVGLVGRQVVGLSVRAVVVGLPQTRAEDSRPRTVIPRTQKKEDDTLNVAPLSRKLKYREYV